jgi:anti-sigma-K factor RskA
MPRAGVTSIPARSERRQPSAIPAWAWAIAAALLLATVYSVHQTRQLDGELAAVQRELREGQAQRAAIDSEREHYEMAMEILSAQDTKTLELMPKKAAMPPVQAYWSAKMGLLVMSANMPQMASNVTLQLWMVPKKGQPMSVGIFRPDGQGHVMMVAAPGEPIAEIAALAISEEPAGRKRAADFGAGLGWAADLEDSTHKDKEKADSSSPAAPRNDSFWGFSASCEAVP